MDLQSSPRQEARAPRKRRRRRRLQVVASSSKAADAAAGTSSGKNSFFAYYDNLRSSFGNGMIVVDAEYADSEYSPVLQNEHDALTESEEGSSVLRILPPSLSIATRADNNNNNSSSPVSSHYDLHSSSLPAAYRLIHVPCAFGFSQTIGHERQVLDTSLFASAKAALVAQHHFNNRIDRITPQLQSKHLDACNVRMTIDFYDTNRSPRTGAAIIHDTFPINQPPCSPPCDRPCPCPWRC
jgi:hypothetical protein